MATLIILVTVAIEVTLVAKARSNSKLAALASKQAAVAKRRVAMRKVA